jgi:hypothetical protein
LVTTYQVVFAISYPISSVLAVSYSN